jgi:predicted ATP-grasp superfamily ATP-dependent carboligase
MDRVPRRPEDLYVLLDQPPLDSPVLVMAPEGWIDAGMGGAAALGSLLSAIETEVVASFDIDELLDHRARRPVAHVVDGVYETLSWPEIELRAGHDAEGHAVLVLVGPEPDHRWKAFAEAVSQLATTFDVRMLVGMGAFPAPVPHTRSAKLAATATSSELAKQVGVVSGSLDVPAGVLVAVERRFAELGIPAVGLWARVPHYAAPWPYPEASVLLLEGLTQVSGLSIDLSALRDAAASTRNRLDELIANSAEHTAMVEQLEARADAEANELAPNGWGDLPSGDDLAAEVERFLRDETS